MGNEIKIRSQVWALIQCVWCPYKERQSGHRVRGKNRWGQTGKVTDQLQAKGVGGRHKGIGPMVSDSQNMERVTFSSVHADGHFAPTHICPLRLPQ